MMVSCEALIFKGEGFIVSTYYFSTIMIFRSVVKFSLHHLKSRSLHLKCRSFPVQFRRAPKDFRPAHRRIMAFFMKDAIAPAGPKDRSNEPIVVGKPVRPGKGKIPEGPRRTSRVIDLPANHSRNHQGQVQFHAIYTPKTLSFLVLLGFRPPDSGRDGF
jgi:hypothetical protein